MFCLPRPYVIPLDGIDWVAAASETSLCFAYLIPWGGSHLTGATSSFTEVWGPACTLSVSERLSDSPELSWAGEQIYKEVTLLCTSQQRGRAVLITCDDQSCVRI